MSARHTTAWTLTFYAYKGGTGRTLALANVARYMAEVLGYRIGLVDLDLESPGLAHEPLCSQLEAGKRGRRSLLKRLNQQRGFVDLFLAQFGRRRVPSLDVAVGDLDRCVVPLASEGDGAIVLMPAARGSVFRESGYPSRLAKFIRHLGETTPDAVGQVTHALLQAFISRYALDFLFLDGRTGTGSFFPVYAYAVPQSLVLFFGLNEQNVSGSLSMLQAQTDIQVEPAPVLLVASPVPTVGPRMLEERLKAVNSELSELRRERQRQVSETEQRYIYELPRSVSFMLPYSDLATYEEAYFPRAFPHSQLAREYRRLAEAIEALVLKRPELPRPDEVVRVHGGQLRRWRNEKDTGPLLRIAAENVTHAHFHTFFAQYYGYENADFHLTTLEGADGGRRLSIGRRAADFEVDLWSSEARGAPWEMLAHGEVLRDPPDVLLIPQVFLGPLAGSDRTGGVELLDLSEQRLRWPEGARPQIFEYGFLDRCYPGWRRWCTLGSRVMAAPFSVNTMLLCANENLLGQVCKPYWQARGHDVAEDGGPFLPSSWSSLIETLRDFNRLAPTDRDWEPFRMVVHERGLYYEWLNIVLALGGVDLMEGEGRLLESVSIAADEVVEATELLRDLAATTVMSRIRMDDQIEAFGLGKLALYVAWTDSFCFQPTGGQLDGGSRASIVQIPGRRQPAGDLRIRLGQLPRNVNFPRRSVVDGWLMVFPRTDDVRQRRALEFASAFLDPDNQLALLRTGFPTPSLWAVERELADLDGGGVHGNAEQRNYSVFLGVLRAAIVQGHWVPSPPKGREVNELIQAGLRKVLEDESAAAADVLSGVEASVKGRLGLPSSV